MRHIMLTCKNHQDLRWTCKSIAFNYPDGGYNGARNIFFRGTVNGKNCPECACSSKDLILAPEEVWDTACEE